MQMRKGWFRIPGVQDGDRTIEEQLLGLEPLLQEVAGKTVLDLGSAEGLISRACIERGASRVYGLEVNRDLLNVAWSLGLDPHRCRFVEADLNQGPDVDDSACCSSDIVLALAIFHKLKDPEPLVRQWVQFARSLVVVRLPVGSRGAFPSKYRAHKTCDLNKLMPQEGFQLERIEKGPRRELVQYWRRLR